MISPYYICYNTKHRGYLLVSCCYGHSVAMIHTDRTFGGSMNEAKLANNDFRCRDCERIGIPKAA